MPLNPPSYSGQDVWFSPDVFANKSEIALWQPPQTREAATDPALQAWVNGCEINAAGTAESANQAAAYRQRLVEAGIVPEAQILEASRIQPNSSDASNNAQTRQPPPAATSTDGVENLRDYPPSLQLSRSWTLGQMTMRPWVTFQHIIPSGGQAGLTRGQLVANLKLVALNLLDPIKDRYPDVFCTCSFRNEPAGATNQHPRGMAADLQFNRTQKSKYYDIAIWIRDNLPFDQLLLEYVSSPSAWIHVSYNPRGPRPYGPCKVGTMLNHSFVNRDGLTNMAPRLNLP